MASKKPVFKPYDQAQLMAFPPTFEELIPTGHTVRIVDRVINAINVEPLLAAYHIRGASNYHPILLLKVLIYGYVTNTYSSRKLAIACRENVPFMWLSGMSKPDHNTINRFRGVRLKHALRSVFEEVVKYLAAEGLLSIEEVYTDGTKIEANANKYTFVWKKAIATNKEKMKKQLADIWDYAQSVATVEDLLPEPPTAKTVSTESINAAVKKLNEVLANNDQVDKKTKAKLRYLTKNYPPNIQKYEQPPTTLTADAGYGSQENYSLLEEKGTEAFVKYNMFDKEQDGHYNKKYPFAASKLFYNAIKDVYICPMGQEMEYQGNVKKITSSGFEQLSRKYQAKNCSNCPLNGACHKSKTNRIIEVNVDLKTLKQRAHEMLNSEQGIRHRKKRCYDVEPVFANIKQNHGFRRFMLRGKEKVEIEWGLLAIAQNLRKKAA